MLYSTERSLRKDQKFKVILGYTREFEDSIRLRLSQEKKKV